MYMHSVTAGIEIEEEEKKPYVYMVDYKLDWHLNKRIAPQPKKKKNQNYVSWFTQPLSLNKIIPLWLS